QTTQLIESVDKATIMVAFFFDSKLHISQFYTCAMCNLKVICIHRAANRQDAHEVAAGGIRMTG
ncbi:hypothetical protein ACQCYF_10665, partial [Salmonella enterica]